MANLEELIQGSEKLEGRQKIARALRIARREWDNIGLSLKLCGDIGEFSKEDFMIGIISEDIIINHPKKCPTKSVSFFSPTYYPMYFVENLAKMDDQIPDKGYRTVEALYTFVELATRASSRLGLVGNFAMGFGAGYANVRTGWIAEKAYPRERLIFEEIFFENSFKKRYDWEFYWNSVQADMKKVFDKFAYWKENPENYATESRSNAVVKPMIV